jgi:hypothetical protein
MTLLVDGKRATVGLPEAIPLLFPFENIFAVPAAKVAMSPTV